MAENHHSNWSDLHAQGRHTGRLLIAAVITLALIVSATYAGQVSTMLSNLAQRVTLRN